MTEENKDSNVLRITKIQVERQMAIFNSPFWKLYSSAFDEKPEEQSDNPPNKLKD